MSSSTSNVATIPLGRRELFAFAERHSSQRLRDYASLSDGVVLCALFNAVFPRRRVRVLWPQSHSVTERTRHNWSVLADGFRSVRMPLALLDRQAIAENDAEKGFSALVLFYFLYQLTRRADYSAEFAMDVSVDLTNFLQSVDSIAVLLLGEAIPWSIVPATVQERLREREEFSATPSARKPSAKRRKGVTESASASRASTSQRDGSTARTSSVDSTVRMQTADGAADDVMRSSTRTPASTPDRDFTMRSPRMHALDGTWNGLTRCLAPAEGDDYGGVDDRDDARRTTDVRSEVNASADYSLANAAHRPPPQQRSQPEPSAADTVAPIQKSTREAILEQQLAWKSEECAQLQSRGIALLAEVANLRAQRIAEPAAAIPSVNDDAYRSKKEEVSSVKGRSRLTVEEQASVEQLIGACLSGTVLNAQTGEEIEVHSLADEMSRLIVKFVPDVGRQRMLQDRLWTFLSAYHTLESRVQVAADVTQTLQGRLNAIERQVSEDHGSSDIAARSALRTPQPVVQPQTVLQKAPVSNSRNARGSSAAHDDEYSPPNAVKALEDDFKRESSTINKSRAADNINTRLLDELEAELIAVIQNRDATFRRLHAEEERNKQLLASLRKRCEAFEGLAHRREESWRTLCAALHRCERLSYNMSTLTERRSNDALRLNDERHSAFTDVQTHTDALLAMPALPDGADAQGTSVEDEAPLSSICAAMEALVSSAVTERDAALSQVRELRQQLLRLGEKMQFLNSGSSDAAVTPPTGPGPISSADFSNSSHCSSVEQRAAGPSVIDGIAAARRMTTDLLRKQQEYERSEIWAVSSSPSSSPAASSSHARSSTRRTDNDGDALHRHLSGEARIQSPHRDVVDVRGTPNASVQSLSRRLYATPMDDRTVPSRVPRNDGTTVPTSWSYNGSPVEIPAYNSGKHTKPSIHRDTNHALNGSNQPLEYPTSLDALLAAGFASPPPH